MTKSRVEKESKNELLTFFCMTAKIEKEKRGTKIDNLMFFNVPLEHLIE